MRSAIKRQEILRSLEEIPAKRLKDIEKLIKSILSKSVHKREKEPKTLKGIWAKKGFEKIVDLQAEVLNARREMQDRLLKKQL